MTESTDTPHSDTPKESGDLSVTALYTAQTWRWGRLPNAELFESKESRAVFGVTNIALAVMKLFSWKLKSLRHSLLHRHVMIDALIDEVKPDVVIELAAGLSRRGVTVSSDERIEYWEIDLPHVVAKKKMRRERTPTGQAMLQRSNHHWIAEDVRNVPLQTMSRSHNKRVYVAEGLCMYLQPNEQRTFWSRIAEDVRSAMGPALFVFDLVPWCEQPKPGWFGRALEWLMKRFTKGQSFARDERTRETICADLKASGFQNVQALEPRDVLQRWRLPYPKKKTQQVIFVCGNEAAEPTISALKVESNPPSIHGQPPHPQP